LQLAVILGSQPADAERILHAGDKDKTGLKNLIIRLQLLMNGSAVLAIIAAQGIHSAPSYNAFHHNPTGQKESSIARPASNLE